MAESIPPTEPQLDLRRVVQRVAENVAYRREMLERGERLDLPRSSRLQDDCVREDRPKNRYDVEDFLALPDAEAVSRAYRALLRREPDHQGHARFVQALRAGTLTKVEVIGRIRYSREGRAKRVRVHGLLVPLVLNSMERLPILGHVVGLARRAFVLPQFAATNRDEPAATSSGPTPSLEPHAALEQNSQAFTMRLVADALAARAKADKLSFDRLTASTSALAAELRRVIEQDAARLARLDSLEAAVRTLGNSLGRVVEQNAAHQTRLDSLETASRALQSARQSEVDTRIAAKRNGTLDAHLYAEIENHFRGTREAIKHRVQEYLPHVGAAHAGSEDAPVLDLGCGHGEWLEVLAENGLRGHGIDASPAMVVSCSQRGLAVVQADALEYLQGLAAGSFGAITAFHLIEHIPFPQLVALVDEIHRVLRPGGMMLLETPNPENLIVGACTFWYDPTHIRPLPPELMRFVCTARGFGEVDIARLHPFPPDQHLSSGDQRTASRLNELLYGWQDYAVIASKR